MKKVLYVSDKYTTVYLYMLLKLFFKFQNSYMYEEHQSKKWEKLMLFCQKSNWMSLSLTVIIN